MYRNAHNKEMIIFNLSMKMKPTIDMKYFIQIISTLSKDLLQNHLSTAYIALNLMFKRKLFFIEG
jgi:hypothetical protein